MPNLCRRVLSLRLGGLRVGALSANYNRREIIRVCLMPSLQAVDASSASQRRLENRVLNFYLHPDKMLRLQTSSARQRRESSPSRLSMLLVVLLNAWLHAQVAEGPAACQDPSQQRSAKRAPFGSGKLVIAFRVELTRGVNVGFSFNRLSLFRMLGICISA